MNPAQAVQFGYEYAHFTFLCQGEGGERGGGLNCGRLKRRAPGPRYYTMRGKRPLEGRERATQRSAVQAGRRNVPIRDWIAEERPRELLLAHGTEGLPLSKLLAVILRTGTAGTSAEELARKILNHFRSLRRMDAAPVAELCRICGVGPAKAAQLKAALELGKRLSREKARLLPGINGAEGALEYVGRYYAPYLRDARKEFFCLILLDFKNKPVAHLEIGRGSISESVVDPKEIVREALLQSASSLIIVHNHPSGEGTPSAEDVRLTERVRQACRLFGIRLLDHIIVGRNKNNCYSFARSTPGD